MKKILSAISIAQKVGQKLKTKKRYIFRAVAIGILASTPYLFRPSPVNAQTLRTTDLLKRVEFRVIPWRGGGDPDIHSQNGRHTWVRVRTYDVEWSSHGVWFSIGIDIVEGHPNHTHLGRHERYFIPITDGRCVVGLDRRRRNVDLEYAVPGEYHDMQNFSRSSVLQDTYLDTLLLRTDGKGDDDRGNAYMGADIAIPVRYVRC